MLIVKNLKIKVMFEKMLICVLFSFFFLINESLFYIFFALFFSFFIHFFSFCLNSYLNRYRTFFYNNNITFKNQILFFLSFYISLALCFRHTIFHSKITHLCFHRKENYFELISSFLSFVKVFFSSIFFSVV